MEKLAYGGEGVARTQPITFVPRSAPGDRLEVELTEEKARMRRAKILRVLEAGPGRREPPCAHYRQGCGGCQLQHLSYPAQLAAKAAQVREALARIGKLNVEVAEPLAAPAELGYRNKATFRKGPAGLGLVGEDGVSVVPLSDCPLLVEAADRLYRKAAAVAAEMPEVGLSTLIVRAGQATGETLLAAHADHPDPFLARLEATTLIALAGDGEEERVVSGPGVIRERIGGHDFFVDARSFLQVNTVQAGRLFTLAVEEAGLTGKERVLDLYCGNGGIALHAAGRAREVVGVESAARSVELGRRSAAAAGLGNVRFRLGRVESTLKALHHAERMKPEVVFLDPPRAGVKPVVIETLARMKPARVVYVSCNPTTLARDLALFARKGYITRRVTPIDLFPQTYHVEAVAALALT